MREPAAEALRAICQGPRNCSGRFSGDVAVLVCDEAALSAAITNGSVGATPFAQINLPGRASGCGQGVVHAVGTLMSPGETATIHLPAGGSPVVFVHRTNSSGQGYASAHAYPNAAGRTVVVGIPSNGPPEFS
jgi:hypothetical protein